MSSWLSSTNAKEIGNLYLILFKSQKFDFRSFLQLLVLVISFLQLVETFGFKLNNQNKQIKFGNGVRGFHTSFSTRLESKDQEYFRLLTEKDIGQETTNPHILAKRQNKSGLPVNASIINKILPNLLKPISESVLVLLSEIKPILLSMNVRVEDTLAGPLKYLDPTYLNNLIGSARENTKSNKK